METEETIKDKDFIKIVVIEDNIEVGIKYPKRSTLKKRFEVLEKTKEVMRKT